jgi:hypothetical protein
MSESNPTSVPDAKKAFRYFAAGYAIVVPVIPAICIVASLETGTWPAVPVWVGPLIFISSLVMGILSLFGRSVEVGVRALVFVSMLVSAICGGLTLFVWFFSRLGC